MAEKEKGELTRLFIIYFKITSDNVFSQHFEKEDEQKEFWNKCKSAEIAVRRAFN